MAAKDPNSGGKGGFAGFLVATVLALGLGAGFGLFLDGQMKGTAGAATAVKDDAGREPDAPKPTVARTDKLVAMAPIVAHLAEPKDALIRIEASLLVDGGAEGADALAAQLAEDYVAYLRTAALTQFQGPSGFQNLREDLMDRATIRDRGIKDVIIHGVVIE